MGRVETPGSGTAQGAAVAAWKSQDLGPRSGRLDERGAGPGVGFWGLATEVGLDNQYISVYVV